MRKLRILYVSQYYPPETGAAPARAMHFARSLMAAGHEVRVVTGIPNHPSGLIDDGYRDGQGRSEVLEGVQVDRVWLYTSSRRGTIQRLLNQLTFAWGAWRKARHSADLDLIVASVPPTFLGLAATSAARKHDVPLVVDVRDDWPRAAIKLGYMKEGIATRVLGYLSERVYDHADHLVLVTPGMQRQFLLRGLEETRATLITNGADTTVFRPTAPEPHAVFRVLYAGTHGLIHGMDVILDAADMMPDAEFLLVGDGVAKPGLVEAAGARGLSNVSFGDSVPPAELNEMLGSADACLATTSAAQFCGETIPVKLFDYLAAGKPVVGALLGDAADVLDTSGGGTVVPPGDSEAMASALREIRDNPLLAAAMSHKGSEFVDREYSRVALGRVFASVVEMAYSAGRAGRVARPSGLYGFMKRLADVALSAGGIFVLSPLLFAIWAYIRLESPGPAVFRQRRSGRWGHVFVMYKFRTMRTDTPDVATHLLENPAAYLTRSGRFLRRTSLDELPQLFNTLGGAMSLVGPRPALYNQYDLIAMRREVDVDSLRPGVTGWAQVNGRDDLDLSDKVSLDAEYLQRVSASVDLSILWRTVAAVFSARGAR